MSQKFINSRIIHKHDLEVNWNKAINFIPLKGELIIYDADENFNYPRIKYGDGETAVTELPFYTKQVDWNQQDVSEIDFLKNKPFYKTETKKVVDYTEIPCPKPDLFFDEVSGPAILDYTLPLNIGDTVTYKLTAEVDGAEEEAISPEELVVVDGSLFTGIKDSLTFAPTSSPDEFIPYYVSGVTRVELDEESELGFRFIGKVDSEGNPIIDEESGLMVADENSSMLFSFYDETGTQFVNPKITIYGLESTITEIEVTFNQDYVESLQSDYNENDSTKPGYVKNRPVYEESKMLNYTRLEYDGSAKFVGGFQVRSGRLGLEISNNKYGLNRVVLDPETEKVLESETYPAITLTLTSNTSDSGVVIPSGATVLRCYVSGYYIAFAYDGVVYNESTGTLSLGDGCIFKSISSPDTELRINGLPSEGRFTHKLPSKLVGCGMTYNRSSLSPQSGYGIQSAILSTIPEVPSSLGDGHIEVVVTDDSERSAGKKVSIYSKDIGLNRQLKTSARDTIVNAINSIYDRTVENKNNITKNKNNITTNASDISRVTMKVDSHTNQISELQEKVSDNSSNISKVSKDLEGTANAVLNTVKGSQLEISDISPIIHNPEVSLFITNKGKNLIEFPYKGTQHSSSTSISYHVNEDGTIVMKKHSIKGDKYWFYLLGDEDNDVITLDEGKKYVISFNYGKQVPDNKLYMEVFFYYAKYEHSNGESGDTNDNNMNFGHITLQDGEYLVLYNNGVGGQSRILRMIVYYDCRNVTEVLDEVEVKVQVEEGETPTEFQRQFIYSDITLESKVGDEVIQSIVPDNSGVVSGLISQYPVTSLSTNLPNNVKISCTYHQDINAKIASLEDQIKQLSGSLDEVLNTIGGAE